MYALGKRKRERKMSSTAAINARARCARVTNANNKNGSLAESSFPLAQSDHVGVALCAEREATLLNLRIRGRKIAIHVLVAADHFSIICSAACAPAAERRIIAIKPEYICVAL